MEKLSRNLLSNLFNLWKEQSKDIRENYGLTCMSAPSEIILSDADSNIGKFTPGVVRGNSVIINSELPDYKKLLPSTIRKLSLESSLPRNLLCDECIDDISFEYARKSIDDEFLRNTWESIWSGHSPPRKIASMVEYNPCEGYKWLDSVSGGSGLNTFVKELTHRSKNQILLTFEDYMKYFSTRIHRFERILDSTELKLVNAIIENPNIPSKDLSILIGISEEWLSRKISQLQKRMVLRKFNHAPFSRIGIRIFQVLISKVTNDIDPFELLKDCPFLYSYRKVVSGDWIGLATLCIPENRQSVELIKDALSLIEKKGFEITTHESISSGIARCFDHYTPKVGIWDIPWEILAIQLQRIHSDNLASSIPRIDKPEERTEIILDELDMKIFECVRLGVSSVSKIRSHLRVGQHRVAEKLQRLRENGLVIKSWEVHNIGLNEYAIIYCNDKKIGRSIAAWALRLPRSIISFSSEEVLMLIIDLPRGGSFGLATALEGLNKGTRIGILSPQTYGSWGLPTVLWDSKFQKWKYPKKRLETWKKQIS